MSHENILYYQNIFLYLIILDINLAPLKENTKRYISIFKPIQL